MAEQTDGTEEDTKIDAKMQQAVWDPNSSDCCGCDWVKIIGSLIVVIFCGLTIFGIVIGTIYHVKSE